MTDIPVETQIGFVLILPQRVLVVVSCFYPHLVRDRGNASERERGE